MADASLDFDVTAECAECGKALSVRSVSIDPVYRSNSMAISISVDLCPYCIDKAHTEGCQEGYDAAL